MRDSRLEGGSDGKGRGRRDGSDGRRSRSRESMRDSERKRRSRSRESARDSSTESMRDWKRRWRFRSRDSKTEQNSDRKAWSRSRESVRDHDVDYRDRWRSLGTSDDAHHRGRRGEASHIEEVKEREEDDQEEYQERIESQLAPQKVDNVERIKEESRRRRQAILEKCKQQQKEQQEPEQKDQQQHELHSLILRLTKLNLEDNPKHVNDNMEGDAVEHTLKGMEFRLVKNIVNGESQNASVVGAGGLGQGSPKGELEWEMTARADDIGLLNQSRASSSEPPPEWIPSKHKIFLSHSGVQKPFTEHLCEKLEAIQHYPFFDRRSESLPNGVKFYDLIMGAAKECLVAILLLSDEFFTKSKWPMMELVQFVKAQESNNKRLKILPLFFKISREEFNRRKNGEEWMAAWKSFQENDKSIDLSMWKHAVSKIQGNNGIEYSGNTEGEAKYIKKVVKAVLNMPGVQLDVKWDMSHVQSKEVLCEPILTKLKEVEQSHVYKVQVVGLFGMGGIGKTTISKEVCNQMFADFGGKVCHVEFGGMSSNDLIKSVLRDLTEASPKILVDQHDKDKLFNILKQRMRRYKVFLVLDNIWEDHIEEVEKYLNVGYHDGSMVLLTSRSRDVLEKQLHIPSSDCMEMPYLDQKGAIGVLLYYCNYNKLTMGIDTKNIVKSSVKECYFLKEKKVTFEIYHYHPLVLKILGMRLRNKSFEEWKKVLESMKFSKFKFKYKYEKHPIFSVLRIGYDALNIQEQTIFLDLALIWVFKGRSQFSKQRFEWEWLCKIHKVSKFDMEESVNVLQQKGLLENVCEVEKLDFSIHDLYVEFAEVEVQHGALSNRCFLLDKHGSDVLDELTKHPLGQCWSSLIRIIIKNSRAQSLERENLHFCKNVEILDIHCCDELQEVYVAGMVRLRCIVITKSKSLRTLVGLNKLSNLIILRCNDCHNFEDLNLKDIPDNFVGLKQLEHLDVSGCKSLLNIVGIGQARALQHLNASGCNSLKELPSDFVGLKQLQHLDVSDCENLSSIVGIGHAIALQHLDASRCNSLMELPCDFVDLKQLQHLDVSGCANLSSIVGIGHATALQHLDASRCNSLKELPGDFVGLKQLQHLNVSRCKSLSSIVGIGHVTALQRLNAFWCCSLKELPGDFVGLKQLRHLNVTGCNKLSSIVGVKHATALQHLDASGCSSLKELPCDFVDLKQLQYLSVSRCENLSSIVGIGHATALQHLNACWCSSLKELSGDFEGLKQLQHLDLSGCANLSSIVGIGHATALQKLCVYGCYSLKELPVDFVGLKQLQHLDVSHCQNLSSIAGIGHATTLQYLNACWCCSLKELPDDFVGLKQLQHLDVSGCTNLSSIVGIGHATALQHLDASRCSSLKELPGDFVGLKQLQHLSLSRNMSLLSVVGIGHATALQHLDASGCSSLKELPGDFVGLKELQHFDVSGCENLSSIVGIGHATTLQHLDASRCSSLKELPGDFVDLKQLQHLSLSRCMSLSSIVGIGHATALQHLDASGCSSLKELPGDFVGLKELQHFDVSGCENLSSIVGIGHATALQYLDATRCSSLKELPGDFVDLKQLLHLDLSCCISLSNIVGIGHATALQHLDASGCSSLKELPSDFVGLKELQHLNWLYPNRDYWEEEKNKKDKGGKGGGGGGSGEGGGKKKGGDNEGDDKEKGKDGNKEHDNKPENIELRVNLCCEACARKMKEKLEKLEGVEKGVFFDTTLGKVIVKATTKPEIVLKQAQKVKKDAVMWPQKKKEPEKILKFPDGESIPPEEERRDMEGGEMKKDR